MSKMQIILFTVVFIYTFIYSNLLSQTPHLILAGDLTPSNVKANTTYIETLPFNGGIIVPTNSWIIANGNPHPGYNALWNEIRDINFQVWDKNYLLLMIGNPPDFFDDWTDVIAYWKDYAKAAKAMGNFAGIAFDNEEYAGPVWNYPEAVTYKNKTLQEYREQVRLRGRQVMEALLTEFPDITVIHYHGPYISDPNTPLFVSLYQTNPSANNLMGSFFMGMIDAKDSASTVVDGGEVYQYRTLPDFKNSYQWRKYTMASDSHNSPIIPSDKRASYPDDVSISFGLYNYNWTQWVDGIGHPMDTSVMRNVVEYSLRTADDLVWLYTEDMDWAGGEVSDAWINAVKKGREAANTITIDGDTSDWGSINSLSKANGQNLAKLKVTNDSTKIYFLIQGNNIGPVTMLFLNTDNEDTTGYQDSDWSSTGADYLLENNELYKATENNDNWSWSSVGTASVVFVQSSNVIEISIEKSALANLSTSITLGVWDMDASYNILSYIPKAGSSFAEYIIEWYTPPPAIPASPSNLSALVVSSTRIDLSWTDNSVDEEGFSVERSIDGGLTFKEIARTNANITSYSNSSLNDSTTYHYRVSAFNNIGYSDYSNTINATTYGGDSRIVYLSDLAFSEIANGWGPIEIDMSNGEIPAGDGVTMTINGKTYLKGIGCHAYSEATWNIGGEYIEFKADIGVDDEVGSFGSVGFEVYVDNVLKYESSTLTGNDDAVSISVDVSEGNELKLIVNDGGGNDITSDHANWADAMLIKSDPTSVKVGLPIEFNLNQNYPNPFNPTTIITYSIKEKVDVKLKVYDILGSEVLTLVNGVKQMGAYKVKFNASGLSSGPYMYQLKAGNFVQTNKMLLMK